MLAPAGCAGPGNSSAGTALDGSPTPVVTRSPASSPGTAGPSMLRDIPAGRSFAEGGGGPLSYTFREEWRKARAGARNWRSGAYLISAAGAFVNDDGVPSEWTFAFVDRAGPDVVLVIQIDPWGKVTASRQVSGDGLSSFVGQYTNRIPYEVIDSDTAVGLGKAALATRYNLAKTRDPRIGLSFSSTDGSGPYWTYTLFNETTAVYVTAQIHAMTSAVTIAG
jgi:hypothetical protein